MTKTFRPTRVTPACEKRAGLDAAVPGVNGAFALDTSVHRAAAGEPPGFASVCASTEPRSPRRRRFVSEAGVNVTEAHVFGRFHAVSRAL